MEDNKERDGSNTDFRILADRYVNRIMHELHLPHELLPLMAPTRH